MSKYFHLEVKDMVASITFDRPPHNFVNAEVLANLADILEALDSNPACRAVVLQSNGKNFCAGADFASDSVPSKDAGNPLYDQAVRLNASRKPIVVAVQGSAVGAGVGLALVGDFRVAADDARFVTPFVRLGFHPGFGLTATLPALIGDQPAKLMMLTGRRVDAARALNLGLVDEVVSRDRLHIAAFELAAELAGGAPLAVQSTLDTLRRNRADLIRRQAEHEDREQRKHFQTDDFREGIRAMAERRTPVFHGR